MEKKYLVTLPFANGAKYTFRNWGTEGVGGINGKRYAYQEPANFYTNENGDVYFNGLFIPVSTGTDGKKYVDIEANNGSYNIGSTYDHTTGKYQQGKTYYRFPIASTAQYVEPKLPEPLPETAVNQSTPVKQSTAQQIRRKTQPLRVVVPELYREGLVKVDENGNTYYEFNASPEAIQNAFASLNVGEKPNPVKYVMPETKNTSSTTESSSLPSTIVRNGSSKIKNLPTEPDKDDTAAILYKYDVGEKHIYQIDPEIAALIRDKLLGSNYLEKTHPIFTTLPIPNQQYNDSIFHVIYKPNPDDFMYQYVDANGFADHTANKLAEVSMAQYSSSDNPIYSIRGGWHYPGIDRKNPNKELTKNSYGNYITLLGNKVLYKAPSSDGEVYAQELGDNTKKMKLSYYKNNSGVSIPFISILDMTDDAHANTLLEIPNLQTYSWKEAIKELVPKQSTVSQIGEGLKNIGKSFVHDIGSIFKRQHGGKLNYLDIFKI